MNIYLVRHGQTEGNMKRFYYGEMDAELNQNGVLELKNLSEKLKDIEFGKIFVSDRRRTQESCRIICQNSKFNRKKEYVIDDRISEMNFGVFEGKSFENIKKLYPNECENWGKDWKNFTIPQGESYRDFFIRIRSFFDYVLSLEEENILVVTHGGVIRTIYCCILDNNLDFFWKFSSKNGDISLVKYEYQNLFIEKIGY